MEKSLKNRKGFTLVELLIVVAIIGILAAIAIPSYRYILDTARITASISALDTVRKEMEAYLTDKGNYPAGINFTNFTDQNGEPILHVINLDALNNKVYSLEQYEGPAVIPDSYRLKAKAIDSRHTLLTVTPQGVSR